MGGFGDGDEGSLQKSAQKSVECSSRGNEERLIFRHIKGDLPEVRRLYGCMVAAGAKDVEACFEALTSIRKLARLPGRTIYPY